MENNFTSYIDLLVPWLSPALISEPYLNRIREIGARLPHLSFGCIECWLGPNEPRVDLNVGVTGKRKEYKIITQWLSNLPEPDDERQRTALKKLRLICNAWSDSHTFLQSQIKVLWLVYDILDPLRLMPVPWMYIQFRENSFIRDAEVRTELIMQTLALMDNGYTQEKQELFRAFFKSLSPDVQVCALGTLTSRNSSLLRVYIVIKTVDDLLRILIDHQWEGNIDELAQEMKRLKPYCDFFALLIDIDPKAQPKIGIECWFDEIHAQDKLVVFTHYLEEKGLCSAPKREALLTWNGSHQVPNTTMFLPVLRPLAVDGKRKEVFIKRIAQYVKLVYEPEKPLVAKGYLYFQSTFGR